MATAFVPTDQAMADRPRRAPLRLVASAAPPTTRYGERRGPNLLTLAAIAALHVLLIVALIKLDVIPVSRPKPSELKVVDIVEDVPPPPVEAAPPPPPPQSPQPPAPAITPVVAPPRIVEAPAASAPIASVPAPAPVVAEAPAVAAPAPAPAIVAAIVPPNGSAKSLNNPAPRYPIESRRKREQGTVRLRVVITVDGRVKEISVARSSGHERLDDAALDVVRRWRFLPGTQAGEPVEAVGYLNIPFQLT